MAKKRKKGNKTMAAQMISALKRNKGMALLTIGLISIMGGLFVYQSLAGTKKPTSTGLKPCVIKREGEFRCDAKDFSKSDAVGMNGTVRVITETGRGRAGEKVAELYSPKSSPMLTMKVEKPEVEDQLTLVKGKKYRFCMTYSVNGQVRMFAPLGVTVTRSRLLPGTGGTKYTTQCADFRNNGGNGGVVSLHFPSSSSTWKPIRVSAFSLKQITGTCDLPYGYIKAPSLKCQPVFK